MILIKENVERLTDDEFVIKRLLSEGYTVINDGTTEPLECPKSEVKKEDDKTINVKKGSDMGIRELREVAKQNGIAGVSSLTKAELFELLKEKELI